MRFPFGRGARQREIDGLRQRIAELQDDITKLAGTLAAESPDVETTDAYRSVQLLRESMRREELTTLHQELAGLEARLETLAADRQPPAPGTPIKPPVNATSSDAAVAPSDPTTVESSATAVEAEAGTAWPGEHEPTAAAMPVSGHGLPSERAIIEPPLLARQPSGAAPPVDEPVETPVRDAEEQPASIADEAAAAEIAGTPSLEEQAAAEAAVVGEALGQPVALEAESQVAAGPVDAAETSEATATADTGIVVSGEAAVAAPAELEGEAVAVAPAESEDEAAAAEQTAGEAPRRRRSARRAAILLLVLLGVAAVGAVAAFESGLIAPGFVPLPTVGPTARPTLPAAGAPTRPPPTLAPTPPPTVAPQPPVAPIAVPADDAVPETQSAAEAIEAVIDSGIIAAPGGFTGALLREGPLTSARNLEFLPNGTPVDILDGSAIGSGFRWLRVRSAQGAIGWVISTVLGR